ncbi:MAG: hypothetical protein C4547_03030 [Phycisphaerales bacterium]|nr:MAG: hypothetical protein C4547_03030 [Phycisphaerales bacterium]
MSCEQIERQLGLRVDGELAPAEQAVVNAHLETCPDCRAELAELRQLAGIIAGLSPVSVPDSLWGSIEQRLDGAESDAAVTRPARCSRLVFVRPWAIAAGIVLTVGLGMLGLSSFDTTARASTVDFAMLLDALPLDAQKAFRKFLVRYDAKPTTPVAAKRIAPHLNFDTPAELPGGFRLQSVYQLRIGRTPAIAAAYDRDGEFLATVFHAPMKLEKFGSHENFPCVIGEHCGHKVQVGAWTLVHVTDPTTCHCLLSRIDEQAEMPAVLTAIAPPVASQPGGHGG